MTSAMLDQTELQRPSISNRKDNRRRAGRSNARGLRGKGAPSPSRSLTSTTSEHSRASQSIANRRESFERVSGSISLGSGTNAPRKRVSSNVNLAALLEQESQRNSCRIKAEPEGMSRNLSTHNLSNHCSQLASKLRNEVSGSVNGSKAPLNNASAYSSCESCDSFGSEDQDEFAEEEIEVPPMGEDEIEVPPLKDFEIQVPPAGNGRKSIRLSITNVGADRGSRSIRLSSSSVTNGLVLNSIDNVDEYSFRRFSCVASSASEIGSSMKDDAKYEMEIYPGHFVPFRNATEIWKALVRGREHTMRCTCLDCECELVSVNDCEHIICPDCHMVNPVFEWPTGVTPNGAGMGLKQAWVEEKQNAEVLATAQMITNATA